MDTLEATAARAQKKAFTTIENVKGQRERITPPAYVDDDKIQLSENSLKVLRRRYLRQDANGEYLETPAGMFYRVASHIAKVESQHGGDVEGLTRTFYDLLTELRFFPNSPTFTGAGTPLGQLAACFTGHMRVTTDQGAKPIGELQVGDRVLTHRGRYRPVTQMHRRAYEGELLRIKVKLIGTTLEVTPEHPILTPDGWVAAGELAVGDRIAIGVHQGVRPAPVFDLADSVYAEELEVQATEEAIRVRKPSVYQNSGRHANWINYFQVERIESSRFSGTVYNCEVEEDHTYVTEGVVVHNCFVLPIEDDMGKERDGIFQTLRNAALIQQTGGGNGFSFSRLRPKGDRVQSSGGRATGPVGFLQAYDEAFGIVHQGGVRRGANMGVLRVDHPDIEEFITCKADEGRIANFNISVAITDEFMQAVKDDTDFHLRNPRDGKVWRTVRARDLFDKIIAYAHHNGEPGALFIDAANRTNPVPHLYDLEATNPCGEQWLGPYENCCLGSINLGVHVTTDADGNTVVDWDELRRTVHEATHFLDNVVSANAYVPAVPELREAALRARRIGLGIMGLGDLMYKLGIRYGSEEGQEFAAQIMEFIRYHCMEKSIDLARQRGPFLAFEGSIYDPNREGGMVWQPPKPLFPFTRDWGRPTLDWSRIVQGIQEHGIRNAAQTTVAPTGTIATVSGCEGYGCEPVFALGYIRHFKDGDKDVELVYMSPLFEEALNRTDLSEEQKEAIKQHVATYGSCQDIPDLPEHIRHTFVVSSDITAEEHVRMQAAIQAFVDNSISKCVVGDALLLTPNGLIPMEELSAMRLPDQFEPLEQDVVSPEGVETTDAFYYGGWRETRRVQLDYGFSIEGTPNHRIQVLDDTGAVVFKELGDLKVGDVAVLYAGQEQFGQAGQPLPPYSGRFLTSSKPVVFPETMSKELAFLLGCITSEGAITRNGVNVTNNDVALLQRLAEIVEHLFGLQGRITSDSRNQVHYLQINSRSLRNWLLMDLGLEAGAENKVLPTCILRASKEEVALFLRGLFLDAYMTQDGKLFGITLASERLIRQLQVLLLNFDVLATVRQTTDRAWNLTVQGGELETLAQQISFVEVWKNDRIRRRNAGRLRRSRNYSRLLPAQVTEALREMQMASSQSLRSQFDTTDPVQAKVYQRMRVNLYQGHRLERSDAQAIYTHLREDASHPYADRFFTQDRSDRVYVQVESICSGFAEVYDVSVPGSHSFIANGLGNHNTCNFPEGATTDDVAKAYMLAWELGCKGLTVYVTGSRQEVVLETKATKSKKTGEVEPSTNGTGTAKSHMNGAGGHEPAADSPVFTKRPRPHLLQGSTYRKDTPLGTAYITVNSDEEGEPFEVFVNIGKAGSDVSAVSEAIGRLISLVLRMPSALPPTERLRWIMDEMAGIGGGRSLGFGANRVRSLPDGVAQVIAEHLSELPPHREAVAGEQLALPLAERPIGDLCPECGEAAFLNIEGCRKCYVCGHSEC